MGDPNRGLYNKFFVERTDGKSTEGQKHHGCEYFVLDLNHDKYAPYALMMYSTMCASEYPMLADDLMEKARRILGGDTWTTVTSE